MQRRVLGVVVVLMGCVLASPLQARERRSPAERHERSARHQARLHAIATGGTAPFTAATLPATYSYVLPAHTPLKRKLAELTKQASTAPTSLQREFFAQRASAVQVRIKDKDEQFIKEVGHPLVPPRLERTQQALAAVVANTTLPLAERAHAERRLLGRVNPRIVQIQVDQLNREPKQFPTLRGSGRPPLFHPASTTQVEYNRLTNTSTVKPRSQ